MNRLGALSLLVPLLVLGSSASAQAAPQCQGQNPTITGTPGASVAGTAGDDVIVTEGATTVAALEGNDLICVTGAGSSSVTVDAGDGNDTVDTTAGTFVVVTLLGRGIDGFVGGPGNDIVSTGAGDDAGETVSTGGGQDHVSSGRQKRPMNNAIDLGEGKDTVLLKGLPGTGSVDGGAERDTIDLWDNSRADWSIDNRKQKVTVDDVTMPVLGIEEFRTDALRWEFLRFRGGPADEDLDVAKFTKANPDGGVLVDMGNGDDRVHLGPLVSGILHGGDGLDDTLVILADPRGSTTGSVWVNLNDGETRIDGGDLSKTTSFAHIELSDFDRNTVQGSGAKNLVTVTGCRATVHGAAGADTVAFSSKGMTCAVRPAARSLTAYGDDGADVLKGGGGDDSLIGGAGQDTAKGGPGRDVCSAESRTRCER